MTPSAWATPCDTLSQRHFVYDWSTNVCFCPGSVESDAEGVQICEHQGPDYVNAPQTLPFEPGAQAATTPATPTAAADVASVSVAKAGTLEHRAASHVQRLGSARAASIAIGLCAQGANRLPKSKQAGGVIVGACLDSLSAAARLKDAERTALRQFGRDTPEELEADELVRASETQAALAEVQSRYGVSPEEFSRRTLRSRGDSRAFGSLLKRHLSAEEFQEVLDAARRLSEERRARILSEVRSPASRFELTYRPGGGRASDAHLKDQLADALHARSAYEAAPTQPSGETTNPAAEPEEIEQFAGLSKPRPGLGDLRADEAAMREVGAAEDEVEEISLFEVVHRKYRGREMFGRLLPTRLVAR